MRNASERARRGIRLVIVFAATWLGCDGGSSGEDDARDVDGVGEGGDGTEEGTVADAVEAEGGEDEGGAGDDGSGGEDAGEPDDGGDFGEGGEGDGADGEADADPGLCPDGFPRGDGSRALTELRHFVPTVEGLTVCPGGDVFVSMFSTGEIWRLPADGSDPAVWATLTGRGPTGLACDDEGRIFVADYGGTEAPGGVRVDREGHAGLALPATVAGQAFEDPNGIVFVPGAGIYMSDSKKGWIVRYVEDSPDSYSVTLVASGEDLLGILGGLFPGANGLAWRAATRTLYVAVSTKDAVLAYDVAVDGSLSAAPVARWGAGDGLNAVDGVAVDESGVLYVNNWLRGEVVRIGGGSEVVGRLTNPASAAFRGGTLLLTSYPTGAGAEGGVWALDAGACGGAR